jgi:hypothetical protein
MHKITCDDLSFEDKDSADKFIRDNNIILFSEDGDIFICYESTAIDISKEWYDITTKTALYFQSNLLDETMSRNLLLVFFSNDDIDINIKKTIQSDIYCCRKIVKSNVKDIEFTIKELIFHSDIITSETKNHSLKEFLTTKHKDILELVSL